MSDEFATYNEVHIHQGHRLVNPAVVRGKRLGLPREICCLSRRETDSGAIQGDRAAEVSRGHSSHCGGEGPNSNRGSRTPTS